MKSLIPILLLTTLLFVSGCTSDTASNTGQITEKAKLTIADTKEAQAPESIEELHKEFEEFEKSQSESSSSPGKSETPEQNETLEEPNEEETEEQNATTESIDIPQEEAAQDQPPKRSCPSCEDSNPCTTDSCSEETDYECKHEAIIPCCGNGECEETESWPACQEDCECSLDCGACEIPDSETCSCLAKTECVQDGCCPGNCTYLEDSDCPRPSVVFSEIYYDPPGNDQYHEWFEIYNNYTIPVDVTKLKFSEDGGNHIIKNITEEKQLAPQSYAVIAENTTQFLEDYPEFDGLLFDSYFSLAKSDFLTLILKIGKEEVVLDVVSYNSTWGGNEVSLEKIDLNGPNTQENWNESTQDKGTPGYKNSIS